MRFSYAWEMRIHDILPCTPDNLLVQVPGHVRLTPNGSPYLSDTRWEVEDNIAVEGTLGEWEGRRILRARYIRPRPRDDIHPHLYIGGSRLHGASIAGLVVGAMGVFIFGLYFREWLRARKALAQAPEQDMIA
jgi:hypothetical protein